jgi:hypothetical protein
MALFRFCACGGAEERVSEIDGWMGDVEEGIDLHMIFVLE